MIEDVELLRKYVKDGCAKSFELIVRRHIGWVYSAALRMVHDAALAEDLAQSVFVLLESRAKTLKPGVSLSGWLFNTLRFLAKDSLRKDQRRRKHEARAAVPESAKAPNGVDDAVWEQMSPLLEEAVATLSEADRMAVLLRFYEAQEFAEIGSELGVSEVTARKRVSRAVKKLGAFFKQKGVMVPAAILAGILFSRSAQAAPAQIVDSVLSAVTGNSGAVACALVKETALRFMNGRRRLAAAIVACMGLLGVALYVLLLGWIVYSPGEESEPSVPMPTLRAGDLPAPDGRLLSEDESLLRPVPKKASGRFEIAQRPPRPQAPVTGIDALWWFREYFDLRNSPVEPKAHANDNAQVEEMIKDPVTGEMHPRSWFDEHVPSFVDTGKGGGGGGAATADAHAATNAPDAAPGKSAGGSEHGDGFAASVVEVVIASSSSATSTPTEAATVIAKYNDVPVHLGGDIAISGTLQDRLMWMAYTSEAYFIMASGQGNDVKVEIIRRSDGKNALIAVVPPGDYASALNVHVSSLPGAYTAFPGGESTALDPNDPALLAAIHAQFGDVPPNRILYGYVNSDGRVVWVSVPEPFIAPALFGIVLLLRRKKRNLPYANPALQS